MLHIRLIAAASLPAVSGAAIYNATIAAGLITLGHTVDLVTEAGDAAPPRTIMLIDGSALPDVPASALASATALIHHPLSLETNPVDAVLQARETALFAAVRHIITTSEQTAARLTSDFGVPAAKITPIPPGIDDLPRASGNDLTPRASGATPPVCRILSLGQLIPRKGQDILLHALARLHDLDWHLTIAGGANDPVYAHGLASLAQTLNITQHVTFHPEATGAALETLWQDADLFALTSHYEGYGMVWAEALRRGLPVIATSTGAAQTLVPPDAGVIAAPGDIEQISKAMRRLIFDCDLRRDMAAAAWQAGQALPSWQQQAQKLADVLT